MKFKVVKFLDHKWGRGPEVDYILYRYGEMYDGGDGWITVSVFKSEQEAMDFAKQYRAVREEKEFTL